MSKPVKEMMTRDLGARYVRAENAVWIELVGVDGLTTNAFRRELRARHMRLEVVKTALFRRACAGGPMAKLADKVTGPVALVTGGESAVDVAKLLDDWLPKLSQKLRLRGALLDGEYLDEAACKDLSKMPTRHDLHCRIVRLILTPGGNVVAAALGPGANIAGILKALVEKLEKAEPAAVEN
jgi:large subunit ribosomal protein L10